MNRKDFLKSAGAGLGMVFVGKELAAAPLVQQTSTCTLIPSETAGPFPLDLSENTAFFRKDIRETQQGVRLNLKLRVVGAGNCLPMRNVRVNIWHCDKDGVYSGYNVANNRGDANSKYLRGYQFTDANGEVEFTTIFPGWYTGRICHIHFQVYVSSTYSAVSQLTFDVAAKNALYTANRTIYAKGTDPLSYSQDNIFSDGYALQLATLTPNTTTGGYDSFMQVTVQGNGTTGVGHIEKETAKVFELGQNFPNPYRTTTTIPFTLKQAATVRLELWDLSGRKVATVLPDEVRSAGEHTLEINPALWGLPTGNYMYQLVATTSQGTFVVPKMMTALR
ncbi:MAG: T9SS type A sorting domain-containing protein [Ignavibacteria bacterium]|nr:T9SS type A sorting domain-containing protein [Ignavibacteria bacterium]